MLNLLSKLKILGLRLEKTCLRCLQTTVADQPLHQPSLISTFVICLLESNISELDTS